MYYFDTSFLAPLVIKEPTSKKVQAFIEKLPSIQCMTSHWTRNYLLAKI